MSEKVAVIGAGPAGSYAAYKLAQNGYEVDLFEEHDVVGKPVQCTGLLTGPIADYVKIDDSFLVNVAKKARIYSPNGSFIEIKLNKGNYIFDRHKFDSYLSEQAVNAGVNLHLGHRFEGKINNGVMINGKEFSANYVVGADGPKSKVAQSFGMDSCNNFVTAPQARVEIKCDPEVIEFWVGIGEFGWLVPENENIVRVGVCATTNADVHFKKLLDLRCKNAKKIEYQGGIIPMYNPKAKIQNGNVMLIGDAAGQVKATTYGGIIFGIMAGDILAKDINNYEKNVKKELNKDLWLSLKMRNTLNQFSEKDYNKLVKIFNEPKLKKILEENDRDFPSKFITKLLLAKPSLLKYGFKIL